MSCHFTLFSISSGRGDVKRGRPAAGATVNGAKGAVDALSEGSDPSHKGSINA